jgi:steroid delta-isomerase-like uncharacterized protein
MKKLLCVVSLAVLLCFAFACQNKAEKAELEKFRAQAKVEEQNKVIIMKWLESINKGDFDTLKQLVAPAYLFYSPSRSAESISIDGYIESIKTMKTAFSDMNWNVLELIPAGERVITRYVGRGVHKGEYGGIQATGKQMEYGGTAIFRIRHGKVVEEMVDNDGLRIMQQLGMELKPKEVKK